MQHSNYESALLLEKWVFARSLNAYEIFQKILKKRWRFYKIAPSVRILPSRIWMCNLFSRVGRHKGNLQKHIWDIGTKVCNNGAPKWQNL